MPLLLADFIYSRDCKPICEKSLTLPTVRVLIRPLLHRTQVTKKSQAAPLRNAVGKACDFFIYRIV